MLKSTILIFVSTTVFASKNELFDRARKEAESVPFSDGLMPTLQYWGPTRPAAKGISASEESDREPSSLEVPGFTKEGSKRENQDRLIEFTVSTGRFDAKVAGVFDGHNGSQASEFIVTHFQRAFLDSIRFYVTLFDSSNNVIVAALSETFNVIEQRLDHFLTRSDKFQVGSCGLVVAVLGDQIITANAGDSEAWFFPSDESAPYRLNERHNADEKEERYRIAREFPGEDVVNLDDKKYRIRGLQVTRSFGDLFLKKRIRGLEHKNPHNRRYISAEPTLTRASGNGWVVLASDGLWDFVKGDKIQIIEKIVHAQDKTPEKKARFIVELANRIAAGNAMDDISVIVLKVGN